MYVRSWVRWHAGAQSIAGRFTPGTFTNQKTKQFREPRLLVVTDPHTDAQVGEYAAFWSLDYMARLMRTLREGAETHCDC